METKQQPLSVDLSTLEGWKEACRILYFFCSQVLRTAWDDKFQNFGVLQKHLCDFLQDYKGEKLFVSVFRGSFKTTELLGFCLWVFCWAVENDEPLSVCYNTSSKDNASIFMEDFRETLRNCDLLHRIFKKVPKDDSAFLRWTSKMVEYKQVKFHVSSLETRQVMRHYTIIINDDLVNDENAFSETERKNVLRKWKLQKSILTKYRKFKVGTEIDVGTPYHHKDLVSHIMKHVHTYKKFVIPYALPESGGVLNLDNRIGILTMPEMYCWEDFQEKRAEMGPGLFGTQYELKIIDDQDKLCDESWIRKWVTLPRSYQRIMVVDPAGTEEKDAPQTGIVVCDIDPGGYIYVIYAEEHAVTPYNLIKLMERIKAQYDPDEIYMEREKYSVTIADTLEHLQSKLNFSFVDHKHRDKTARIFRLKQVIETGRLLIGEGMLTLEDRLMNYPDCPKDLLDALAYVLQVMNPPKRSIERERNLGNDREDDFEEEMKRNFVYPRETEARFNDAIF